MFNFGHQSLSALLALMVLVGQLTVIPMDCCCQAQDKKASCCAREVSSTQHSCCSEKTTISESCCCRGACGDEVVSRGCGCGTSEGAQQEAPVPSRRSSELLIVPISFDELLQRPILPSTATVERIDLNQPLLARTTIEQWIGQKQKRMTCAFDNN